MPFGMPHGFADLLRRKYDIMQQQADSQRIAVNAGANLDTVRAGLMPRESAASIDETRARTTNLGLTGQTIIPLATAQIGLAGAQARNFNASAAQEDEQTVGLRQINRVRGRGAFGLGTIGDALGSNLRLGF